MVKLSQITDEDLERDLQEWVEEYAEEKVKAGVWPHEGSIERSRKEFEHLLPQGKDTPDQYVMSVLDDSGTRIGSIWFGVYRNTEPYGAFIWDFRISEQMRGRGYGKATLEELDKMLKEMNIGKLSLHAFAHNEVAVSLYKKMGFEITDLVMAKEIK